MIQLDRDSNSGQVVVIGYGNTLRRDDGVGPYVAAAVAAWKLPGVIGLAVPQLTPELAVKLAESRLAVFVDARPAQAGERIRLEELQVAEGTRGIGHISDPRHLLWLTKTLYARQPRARLLTLPGMDFTLGEGFSKSAAAAIDAALRQLNDLLIREVSVSQAVLGRHDQ
jgi:hydrogenase maturation protease